MERGTRFGTTPTFVTVKVCVTGNVEPGKEKRYLGSSRMPGAIETRKEPWASVPPLAAKLTHASSPANGTSVPSTMLTRYCHPPFWHGLRVRAVAAIRLSVRRTGGGEYSEQAHRCAEGETRGQRTLQSG